MSSPDDLRIGDSERDEVTRVLHDAFAQGRITRDEFDERVASALSARTAGDLRPLTADLPRTEGAQPWRGRQSAPWEGAARPPGPHGEPVAGPYGLPGDPRWPGRHGDLGTWGWHLAAARRGRPGRPPRGARRGAPPIAFLALAALLVTALVTGAVWPLLGVAKLLFFVWLITMVFGVRRHRHRHHHHWHRT